MISLTDLAKNYIENLLSKANKDALYVSVEKGGCSGMQYKFSYLDYETADKANGNHMIDFGKFKIFIDKHALLFIIGTQLDYIETNTSAKLIFKNPNAKHNCGCGKSFGV